MSNPGGVDRQRIWGAVLRISPATRKKLSSEHSVDANDVAASVTCADTLTATWNDDSDRGRRAIVEERVRGRRILVVLYPTSEDDVWNLGSAYPVDRQ